MTNPRRPSSPRGGVGPDRTAPRRFAARRGFARSDWSEVRDRVDLAGVATRLMGPPPGRRGEAGKRLWWPCPFHDDANPSFCVEPEKPWWRCYGCGDHGDAIALAMKYRRMSFREAMGFVLGDATLEPRPRWPRGKPRPEPDETPAPPGDARDEDIRRIVAMLGQELDGLASVATFGGSSGRSDDRTRIAASLCPIRFAAHDADEAGETAAAAWSRGAERVRPPAGKDWTEAMKAGIDLRRWWIENHFPEVFDREERAAIMEFDGGLSRDAAEEAAGIPFGDEPWRKD